MWNKECSGKEKKKKKDCPFLLLENSRPLSPLWEPQTHLSSGTPRLLINLPRKRLRGGKYTQKNYTKKVLVTWIIMMLLKCYTQYVSKFGKVCSGHRTGKVFVSFQSQRRAMPKDVQILYNCAYFPYSKSFKLGFSSKIGSEKEEKCKVVSTWNAKVELFNVE